MRKTHLSLKAAKKDQEDFEKELKEYEREVEELKKKAQQEEEKLKEELEKGSSAMEVLKQAGMKTFEEALPALSAGLMAK